MKKHLNHLLIAALLLPGLAHAQESTRKPVDTLSSSKFVDKVVIYDDKSWSYLQPDSLFVRVERNAPDSLADSLRVDFCAEDWLANSVATFHKTVEELPDSIILNFDSLSVFHSPITGNVSSHYGIRKGRRHTGTDISLQYGTPIYAAFDGKVRSSMYNGGYGNLVIIRHANGMETYYAHLSARTVSEGDWVKAGDMIGTGGNTGRSTGPHLHFETRFLGFPFDPCRMIDFVTGTLHSSEFVLRRAYFGSDSRYIDDANGAVSSLIAESKASGSAAAPAPQKVYHKVKSGENLSVIAKKYHTTVGQICKLNNISAQKVIQPGQRLRVK